MGKWYAASPNLTNSGCTSQGWRGNVGSSDYCTTTAISIPSGVSASLSFNYSYNYSIGLPTVSVGTSPTTTSVVETLPSVSTCTAHTIDLSSYAGQTIYIRFDENSSSTTYNIILDDVLVTYTTIPAPAYTYWVTSITGSGYTGTLNISPVDNSTVYACWGSGLTLNSNMSANTIVSGGKTYYRKWQYSDDGGVTFYVPGSPPSTASCATSGFVASRYYRIVYSYLSSSTDILYPSPWVHVILGPSSVADPTNLSTTNITPTSFTANWTSSATVCAGGGLGIIHRIDVATDASFSNMLSGYPKDVTSCITNGATTCSYDVTGLTTGVTYYWRVKAMSYHVGTNNGDLYSTPHFLDHKKYKCS